MWIKIGNKKAVEIHNDVVRSVLSIYPEEKLIERQIFSDGLNNNQISYKDLLKESSSMLIPWQMFFLTPENFKIQKSHIEEFRENKFSAKFFTKRTGVGKITSKRIIDRLIRLQNFVVKGSILPKNKFCDSLTGQGVSHCITNLKSFLEINDKNFYSKSAENALKYLIEMSESKNINISRGVLKGGILPEIKGVSGVYKNTSGFVIKDDYVPFIFLPDEINPDEVIGRRIYTLMYLLVCVGLNDFDFYVETEFKASALKTTGLENKKHAIVSGILLPKEETEKLRNMGITKNIISQLTSKYKITPTAVVVTLKRRGIIKTKSEYEALLPETYKPRKQPSSPRKAAKIITSVEKFCGKTAFNIINDGIKSKTLKSIEAQWLIFGGIRKSKYKEYCAQIGV